MSTEEARKLQAIIADGVEREGLQEIVLTAEESAAKRLAELVSDAAIDKMIADAQDSGIPLLDGPDGLIGQPPGACLVQGDGPDTGAALRRPAVPPRVRRSP